MPALPKQAPKFAYQAPLGVELDSNGEQKMLKEHIRKASLGSVPHYSASWVRYSRLMRGRIPGLAGADSARFNTRLSNASYLDEQVNASHYVPPNICTKHIASIPHCPLFSGFLRPYAHNRSRATT